MKLVFTIISSIGFCNLIYFLHVTIRNQRESMLVSNRYFLTILKNFIPSVPEICTMYMLGFRLEPIDIELLTSECSILSINLPVISKIEILSIY